MEPPYEEEFEDLDELEEQEIEAAANRRQFMFMLLGLGGILVIAVVAFAVILLSRNGTKSEIELTNEAVVATNQAIGLAIVATETVQRTSQAVAMAQTQEAEQQAVNATATSAAKTAAVTPTATQTSTPTPVVAPTRTSTPESGRGATRSCPSASSWSVPPALR